MLLTEIEAIVELVDLIKNKIKSSGPITFAEFMQISLYSPDFGYYTTKSNKIGKKGDFVTAPEVSSLFGYSLATQFKQILSLIENPVILEFGAGTGKLCVDILTELESTHSLPSFYYIIDVSGELKDKQKQFISEKIPHLLNRIKWISNLPQEPIQGAIIANEVLDAMPVERFVLNSSGLFEVYINVLDDELKEVMLPATNSELKSYVKEFIKHDIDNYMSEANLIMAHWLKEISQTIQKGAVFIIDYGFPAHEYYHPDRNGGTIMCHYQQKANPNPLINIGKQDITAHVNFTHVAEVAFANGFNIAGFTNQASFLLNSNILDFLKDLKDKDLIIANQEIKTLLQPSEMGELLKVIALTKQLDIDLIGFRLNDKRVSL